MIPGSWKRKKKRNWKLGKGGNISFIHVQNFWSWNSVMWRWKFVFGSVQKVLAFQNIDWEFRSLGHLSLWCRKMHPGVWSNFCQNNEYYYFFGNFLFLDSKQLFDKVRTELINWRQILQSKSSSISKKSGLHCCHSFLWLFFNKLL